MNVRLHPHAIDRMEERGIDHEDVMLCLKRGKAYGPEFVKGEWRANVVHRGCAVRVVIGDIEHAAADWSLLKSFLVVTVIEAK